MNDSYRVIFITVSLPHIPTSSHIFRIQNMLLAYLPLFGLALVVARFLHIHFFHPLRRFPGPFWAVHTDLWRVYQLSTKRFPEKLLELHTRYGPVVRIAPNELSFDGVGIIEQVYKGGRKFVKSNFYDGFTTFHPNLFGTRDEEVSTLPPAIGWKH